MSYQEYWIGKGINLDSLWKDFDSGHAYIDKFKTIEPYLLRLTFTGYPENLPLFDHEVIYKTVKGTFHDVKKECLTPREYDEASPIFLYKVNRGSGIFEFLAQFDPLMTYIVALAAAMKYYRSAFQDDQSIDEKRFNLIRSNFPDASQKDVLAYMKAWTTWGRRRILHRLIENGLTKIEVSKSSFDGSKGSEKCETIDIIEIIDNDLME